MARQIPDYKDACGTIIRAVPPDFEKGLFMVDVKEPTAFNPKFQH